MTSLYADDDARRARIDALLAELDTPPPPPKRSFLRRFWKIILALIVVAIVATGVWLVVTAPLGRALEPLKNPSLVLLDDAGHPIARRGDYKELPVTIAELPKYVPQAIVSIEDRRFYSHWGIDPQGIARAMFRNAEAGGVSQGGSTLTQQLAKTSFLSSDRTIKRKLQEIIIAFYLESRLTKDQILSRYLSSVYFGEGAYGLRAAARTYFDREPEDLTVGQAAMLAGLVKAPSSLAPSRHLSRAQDRERVVLQAMVETGALTAAQASRVAPARYTPGRKAIPTGSYFADWVLPQARGVVDPGQYGDVAVKTTLDPALQHDAERAVGDMLAGAGGLNIHQAALVAMRPDGRVVAMVGGANYAATPFNRATQALRQPGSSFKLFVYLAALHAGATTGTIIDDSPTTIGDWSPKNDEGKYRGRISLATAFAASSNIAAAKLTQQVGVEAVRKQARLLGVTVPLSNYEGLALGTSGVPLIELTSAYAAVANGAYPVKPVGLASPRPPGLIDTVRGAVAATRGWPERGPMLELLQSAVRHGTGQAALLGIATYGKTGTTQNHRDALFIGFAGDLVVGVWVGNDDNSPMTGVVGGTVPAKLWKKFMTAALTREGLLRPAPVQRSPVDAIGDLVGNVVGDAVGAATGEAADAIGQALDGVRERRENRTEPPEPPEPPQPD
ncbi:PBP1A family penicillin-binding protein [Polymorphobacter sp. PAMC 29334]|uniref:transglycosylase domain-containing protein n=1 Tax=Polymorphobacter sp. PAMC 29334 TaxID=2862331 RepID=UPI001C788642|nr:PBP1A family penicillin-binding protein [Polymorphobacter sp. PAMC 29334]QYE35335.1 PBP1A family penicillin-binding protein [Polymorphobacter sp. PAMC 29334]